MEPGAGVSTVRTEPGERDVCVVGLCWNQQKTGIRSDLRAGRRKSRTREEPFTEKSVGKVARPKDDGMTGAGKGLGEKPITLRAVPLERQVVERVVDPDDHFEPLPRIFFSRMPVHSFAKTQDSMRRCPSGRNQLRTMAGFERKEAFAR